MNPKFDALIKRAAEGRLQELGATRKEAQQIVSRQPIPELMERLPTATLAKAWWSSRHG